MLIDGQLVACPHRWIGIEDIVLPRVLFLADVANLCDCCSITMARDLEDMGFCKPGEGVAFVKDGNTRLDGSLPANAAGGLLSGSHCGEPAGMPTIEVAVDPPNAL